MHEYSYILEVLICGAYFFILCMFVRWAACFRVSSTHSLFSIYLRPLLVCARVRRHALSLRSIICFIFLCGKDYCLRRGEQRAVVYVRGYILYVNAVILFRAFIYIGFYERRKGAGGGIVSSL